MAGFEKAFAAFMGASFIGSLTQVAKGKLSAIFLGAEGVGILNQLTNVWSLFSVVAGLGSYSGMLRNMSGYWGRDERDAFRAHMSSAFSLLLVVSLVLTLLGCLFSARISAFVFDDGGARSDLVCLILLSLPLFQIGQVYRATLNATKSVSYMVRARISADVLSVAAFAVFLWAFDIRGAILGYISLHLAFLLFSVVYVGRALGRDVMIPRIVEFDWQEIGSNVGFGINAMIRMGSATIVAILISRWIISELGADQNGLFAMALKVTSVYLGGLYGAAGGYYLPTLSAAKTPEEMGGHVRDTLCIYLYLVPPIIVVLMAFGDALMVVLFSAEFIPAATLLLLMLPGDLFRIVADTVGLALIVEKRFLYSTSFFILTALIYLGFASYFLPLYGIAGVALSYLLSQVISAVLQISGAWIVLGIKLSPRALFAFARGFAFVGAASMLFWLGASLMSHLLAAIVLMAIWFLLSLADPAFVAMTRKIYARLSRRSPAPDR